MASGAEAPSSSSAAAAFEGVLGRPDAASAVAALRELVAAVNASGYRSAALRQALYEGGQLAALLDRAHGEHRDWGVPLAAACWWDYCDHSRAREWRDAAEEGTLPALAKTMPALEAARCQVRRRGDDRLLLE
jgi:hypothetical protein